jgi:hypothetical protein
MDIDIDRTHTAALWTQTLVDPHYRLVHNTFRYLTGKSQESTPSGASCIAEAKFTLALSAKKNSGATIVAFCHVDSCLSAIYRWVIEKN